MVVRIPALKQRLSAHALWTPIAWRDLEEAGKVFPSANIRDNICTLAKAHDVSEELVPTISEWHLTNRWPGK